MQKVVGKSSAATGDGSEQAAPGRLAELKASASAVADAGRQKLASAAASSTAALGEAGKGAMEKGNEASKDVMAPRIAKTNQVIDKYSGKNRDEDGTKTGSAESYVNASRNKMSLIMLIGYFLYAWNMVSSSVTADRQLKVNLMHTPPEMTFFKIFLPLAMYLVVSIAIVFILLVIWDIFVVLDFGEAIGYKNINTCLSLVVIDRMDLVPVIMIATVSAACTWMMSYGYTYFLHERRAPPNSYDQMVRAILLFNLFITVAVLFMYIMIS